MVKISAKDEEFRKEVQTGNIWRIVFKVCVPLALYSWMSQLFAVLDTLMASGISSDAVSTVVYMVQLQHVVLAIGGGLSVGGGIMIAHAYGKGDAEQIKKVLSTTITLCIILSIVILLILPFTPIILRITGTPEVFVSMGSVYFSVTLIGIIIQFFNTIYISNERCRGKSRKILALNLITVIVKLLLTAIFVYLLSGDIVSIAFASLASYLIIFVFALSSFIKKDDAFSYSIRYISFKGLLSPILKLSIPSMVEKIAFAVGKAMVNNMASGYGTQIVGAAGISNNMSGLLTGIQTGFEDGGSSLEGQLYGSINALCRNVRFYPMAYILVDRLSSIADNNRLLVSFTDGMLHAVAAERDRLLFVNSFPAADLATAEYFIFSVVKEVMFNPEHTVLHVFGKADEKVASELAKYFASVKRIS